MLSLRTNMVIRNPKLRQSSLLKAETIRPVVLTGQDTPPRTQDLLEIPSLQAASNVFPPGCLVLRTTAPPTVGYVDKILICLNSKDFIYRLLPRDYYDESVLYAREDELQLATSCPVWARPVHFMTDEDEVPAVVIGSYEIDNKVYFSVHEANRPDMKYHGIPAPSVRYRADDVSILQQHQSSPLSASTAKQEQNDTKQEYNSNVYDEYSKDDKKRVTPDNSVDDEEQHEVSLSPRPIKRVRFASGHTTIEDLSHPLSPVKSKETVAPDEKSIRDILSRVKSKTEADSEAETIHKSKTNFKNEPQDDSFYTSATEIIEEFIAKKESKDAEPKPVESNKDQDDWFATQDCEIIEEPSPKAPVDEISINHGPVRCTKKMYLPQIIAPALISEILLGDHNQTHKYLQERFRCKIALVGFPFTKKQTPELLHAAISGWDRDVSDCMGYIEQQLIDSVPHIDRPRMLYQIAKANSEGEVVYQKVASGPNARLAWICAIDLPPNSKNWTGLFIGSRGDGIRTLEKSCTVGIEVGSVRYIFISGDDFHAVKDCVEMAKARKIWAEHKWADSNF